MSKARNSSFDLLRICAAAMVVMLHVASTHCWYEMPPNSTEWMAMNFYDCLTRSAVPLFFMLSGAFMLKKEVAIKTLYLKKIIPLIFVYFVWSLLYALDTLGLDGAMELGIVEVIRVTVNSHFHLWFLPMLIGIYILQPVLHAVVSFENGKCVKYLLCVFFLFSVLRPTILLFVNKQILVTVMSSIPVELMGYSGYVILGHYLTNIHKQKYNSGILISIFAVAVVAATVLGQMDAINRGVPNGLLYDYFSLTSFAEAVALFLWFKNLDLGKNQKIQNVLYKMSTLTLGIYLIHPFIISQLEDKLHINTLSYNTVLSVPVNTIMITVISILITWVMTKIPLIKRIWTF